MAAIYNTAAGNARLVAATTAAVLGQSIDGGAGFGLLVIGTSALSGATGVLATFTLQKPSFSIAGKVATLLGTPLSTTGSATGAPALAEFRDSNSTTIISGLTVATSGADIIINVDFVTSGQTVTCNSGTMTTQ